LWWDRVDKGLLFGLLLLGFLTSATGITAAFILRKRSDPMEVTKQFVVGAGFQRVEAVSRDAFLLNSNDNRMASFEMERGMARHHVGDACVIPVIIRSVGWSGAPFATPQALPKDARPVARWQDRDEAWTDIARGLRRAAEGLRKRWLPS
jgi:hypothetical protein